MTYRRVERDWGDGITGLKYNMVINNLFSNYKFSNRFSNIFSNNMVTNNMVINNVAGWSGGGICDARGAITKAGNVRLRRLLVEAAWHYRHRPAVGYRLRKRREGQPARVRGGAAPSRSASCWPPAPGEAPSLRAGWSRRRPRELSRRPAPPSWCAARVR